MLAALLCLVNARVLAAGAGSNDDAASLVQTQLKTVPDVQTQQPVHADGTTMLYRLVMTRTHGADHSCLTEIEFLDAFKRQLIGKYHWQSSCYGCAVSCDECEEDFGNPTAQFDQISSSEAFNAWSCTAPGSFPDGVGNQELQFSLDERPTMVVLKYPHTNGQWLLKDFSMQVKMPDGTWQTIATVRDAPNEVEQFFFVQMFGSQEKPMNWPIQYDQCGEYADSPILVTADKDPPTLTATFTPLADRALSNMGTEASMMFAVDGDFGNITIQPTGLGATTYVIRQVTVNFPATHRFLPYGVTSPLTADLEAHFIMQKLGSMGIFDLGVVTLLMNLPKETDDFTPSELFFRELGLETLPMTGAAKSIARPVDLSVFSQQFAGGLSELKCSQDVQWFLLHEPAFISGSILHAMKVGPIPPEADECDLILSAEEDKIAEELTQSGVINLAPADGSGLTAHELKRKECEEGRRQKAEEEVQIASATAA